MEIAKLIATGILTTVCVLIIKDSKQDLAVLVGVCGGVVMLSMIFSQLAEVVTAMNNIALKSGISNDLFKQIIKILGIGYVTDFSSNICEDSGAKSVADKIQLSGKIAIMVVALPIVTSIIDIVASVLQ